MSHDDGLFHVLDDSRVLQLDRLQSVILRATLTLAGSEKQRFKALFGHLVQRAKGHVGARVEDHRLELGHRGLHETFGPHKVRVFDACFPEAFITRLHRILGVVGANGVEDGLFGVLDFTFFLLLFFFVIFDISVALSRQELDDFERDLFSDVLERRFALLRGEKCHSQNGDDHGEKRAADGNL